MQRSELDPQRWRAIERLYHASIDVPADERSRFLAEACADPDVRQQVASLLVSRDRGLSFIDKPALDVAAEMIDRGDRETLVGRAVGPYRVMSLVGGGGMGVVYRAYDSRLNRDVALKVLPAVGDDRAIARIEHEARLLASLNHQNIAAIHDVEESDGLSCLVLEFIDGETLADRLRRNRIHLNEALAICRQIAEALEAAHERGIVHRDLKPANVMITPSGGVKVLDFGIAGLLTSDPSASAAASSEVGGPITAVVSGTPAYMSPEQARGIAWDKRADIWAFGCVFYEVLTGKRAFEHDALAARSSDVEIEPDWSALPATTPRWVADLLRRCLERNPYWRLRDIGDARIELVERSRSQDEGTIAMRRARNPLLMLAGAAAAFITGLVALPLLQQRSRGVVDELRLEVTTPPTADPVSLAISPDGEKIVFVAANEGRSQLWLRSLHSPSARPLLQTDHAACPFWSPDSTMVGFFAGARVKRVNIESGAVHDVVEALSCGGAWSRDGTLLHTGPLFGPISRFPALTQGPANAMPATRLERPAQRTHRVPHFLPDQRHFLYYVDGSADSRGVYVADLGAPEEARRLLDADTAAVYASGHLLFVRQGALFAQPFDPTTLTLTADAFQVAQPVAFDPVRYLAALSVSTDGRIVYRGGSVAGRRQLVWVDRSGAELQRVGDPDSAGSLDPSLSPDEQQVAFYRTVNAQPDVWLFDAKRGALSRFTTNGRALRPIWSPDGRAMVYAWGVPTNLYRRTVIGPGDEHAILETSQPKGPTDWSRDGRFIVYRSNDPQTGWDLWALPMDGARNPIEAVRTRFDERDGQLSPDGKWLAYQSNESGQFEIYLQPFLRSGPRSIVSQGGGAQVRWRADGKELFYVAFDNRLMAVPIRIGAEDQPIEVGVPVPLFTTRMGGAVQGPNRQQYMVSSDGRRFLMNTIVDEATSPIVVLLNWRGRR